MMTWLWLLTALAAPLEAQEAVSRALERAPALASARAELAAADGDRRATALFREDPLVRARWAAIGDVHGVTVLQPVSLTGEGLAAHRAATAAAESAEAQLRRSRLEVAAEARAAWALAVEAQEAVTLTAEGYALATRLREGAEARLASGDGALLDARLARLQETEARATWMAAVAAEGSALAALSVLTGVSVLEMALPADPAAAMPPVTLADTDRSDVRAAQQDVATAQARLRQQRANVLPPVQLGAFYEQEGEELRIGPQLNFTIPLWRRNADGRAAALGQLDLAESVSAERLRLATAEQQATAAVLATLEDAGPGGDPRAEARAALESVAMGYARGELDLLTAGLLRVQILDGQRAWLASRRVLALARIDAALAHEAESLL